jgi:hypothetical protein
VTGESDERQKGVAEVAQPSKIGKSERKGRFS